MSSRLANSLALVVFLLSFRPALVAGQTAGQSIAPVQAVPAKVLPAQAAGSVQATGSFQIIQGAQISPAIQLAPAAQIAPAGSVQGTDPSQAAGGPVDPAEAAAQAEQQQRTQQLTSLQFRRTPSAIIEAWRTTELPAAAAPEAQATASSAEPLPGQPPNPKFDPNNALTWPADRFSKFLTELQNQFALSDWERLSANLAFLPVEQRDQTVNQMIQSLGSDLPPDELAQLRMQNQNRGVDPRTLEKQKVSFEDVLRLARLSSKRPLPESLLRSMGQATSAAIQQGRAREELVQQLAAETALPEQEQLVNRAQAAQLLVFANQLDVAAGFLPSLDEALQANNFEALNLLSAIFSGEYRREPKTSTLEQAWQATLAVLAGSKLDDPVYLKAMTQAVSLASQVRKELGQAWLESSFTAEPQRGIAILSGIGSQSAQALAQATFEEAARLELLKLQNTAVEALLRANPQQAEQWRGILELLANNWLREVPITYSEDLSTTFGPQMRRDLFGNIFYYDESMGEMPNRGQRVNPIMTADLLDVRPSDTWIGLLDPSLQPKFRYSVAQLYLKVGEESLSFPFIEKLGQSHPRLAKDLFREFLTVWTKNHNPNADRQRSNPYMFMYGFESRAESIPLTRSKQERNLEELAGLVPKLRELNGGELDPELLVNAFLTSHSFAEVYRKEDLEKVFGPMAGIPPKVIAQLAQKMRENLASVWREVEVQKQAKTKRNRKEVEAEVVAGYAAANQLLATAAEQHPNDPALLTLKAALLHDENGYQAELKSSPEFATRRRAAFAAFRAAADAYARQVSDLEPSERNTEVYERWFYAALGACDLKLVDEKQVADETQYPQIAAAIQNLPAPHAEWHLARFANLLFNRMSNAQPAVKARYLRGGFAIAGDHPQARQARAVFDYYNDLVREIKLETVVDGTDRVGTEPFGVYVNLLHTREIERESGGFGRYLQNQNNNNVFVYNYGRPLENYRDKFEEFVRNALQEHFDIQSVTFQVPEVNSKPGQPAGWRRTPYAYLLLKARGPQVDRLPPLKLDLDFLDTTGYAILPIESPALPLDCQTAGADPRPFELKNVTQILDERQADKGQLLVEVKATGHGLMPDLKTLFPELNFPGFQLGEVEDNGLSVSRFDPESAEASIVSDRAWVLHLTADPANPTLPQSFSFGEPAVTANEVVYQRYVDADLKTVQPTIELEARYGQSNRWSAYWPWAVAGLSGLAGLGWWLSRLRQRPSQETSQRTLPEALTPFQAIAILQEVEQSKRLPPDALIQLRQTIADLEQRFFDDNVTTLPSHSELRELAQRWLSKA
ncbi:MAG: hypothetical protein ACK6DS_14730 [Planctomycetota bacterium]